MVTIQWCLKTKDGIKIIEPNDNLAEGYLKKADAALGTMNRERNYNITFAISACYYSMYYALYAVLMKIGIKCEIHSCTLEFMNAILEKFYSKDDFYVIKKAFDARNATQYYIDKIIAEKDYNTLIKQAPFFTSKSKEIISKINENQIEKIRKDISNMMK